MTEPNTQPTEIDAPAIFDGYIDEHEYCRQRGVSLRTAQRDRQLRQAPPYLVVGKKVYYRIAAIREWMLRQEHREVRKSQSVHRRVA